MKFDFRKTIGTYTSVPDHFEVVEVPPLHYLMIDGQGDPNTSDVFSRAVATLYPLSYAIKFASKNDLDRDYVVMPLEGQWWAPDMSVFTRDLDKSAWHWTLLMMVPDWIDEEMVRAGRAKVGARHPDLDVGAVRHERVEEGTCVQTLHIGPFDAEGLVLHRLHHEFIPAHNLQVTGKHHEIYLSDFRKTPPEKLRTILRQPVAPA